MLRTGLRITLSAALQKPRTQVFYRFLKSLDTGLSLGCPKQLKIFGEKYNYLIWKGLDLLLNFSTDFLFK